MPIKVVVYHFCESRKDSINWLLYRMAPSHVCIHVGVGGVGNERDEY
jgi:hypothetical protein